MVGRAVITAVLSNATSVTPSTRPTASRRWWAFSGVRTDTDVDTRRAYEQTPAHVISPRLVSDRAARHRGQRPRAASLERERQVEQPLLVEMASCHLQTDGQRTVLRGNEAGWDRHGRA